MATPRTRGKNEGKTERQRIRSGASVAVPFPADVVRAVISNVKPLVDAGRRPAKASLGDLLQVEADAFIDGHDVVCCELRFRHESDVKWTSVTMCELGNDRWAGILPVDRLGRYRFVVRAGVDRFATWRRDLRARLDADQSVDEEYLVGAQLMQEVTRRAKTGDRRRLTEVANGLRSTESLERSEACAEVFSDWLSELVGSLRDPAHCVSSETLYVWADPAKARFSTWYELFPRSAAPLPHRHGTFADVEARLEYVESMGFDVLYLPPIHPIGRSGRKGRDGAVASGADDPGSPWAIGAREGGHTAIHPELGSLDDFRSLVKAAAARGIDVALDLAFQASPDHPWVQEHPDWFYHLPGGSIRYAENPPKRYEDIYPLNFEGLEWRALWYELLEVVRFWIDQGVTVFRVDNPHTKPFAFWEWLLASVQAEHPETIFLAEAFTRPRVMEQLAKIGFTQSYTYFSWRSSKWEIESYMRELTESPVADYFRPNFWPNTPDILTEELQEGGRATFLARFVLAATLSASYGIYGPTFELQESAPRAKGSEEYLHSEKYEIRTWDLTNPQSLSGFIAMVNTVRREHPALQFNDRLTFHPVDNDHLIAYSKSRPGAGRDDVIVVVVNLDYHYPQSGWVALNLQALGVDPQSPYVMHDLLTDAHYFWSGSRNFVKLDPNGLPCHIFALEQPVEQWRLRK
ncbi:MAG TPA: alpha-1,4-glucan--maltose-1-phosphate maltosyltransferase [Acidimicrobiales bacterium]|nr:alpha-1,4-glucan--maltose-1-phosphate maltosyltransferase [Acidimicrobiales bacterium]